MAASAVRTLSSLVESELFQLLDELRSTDAQGAVLVEAYLDRRCEGWRNRKTESREKTRRHPKGATMTANEAYDVLASSREPNKNRFAPRTDD